MKTIAKKNVVKEAEIVKALIIGGTVGSVLLFKAGVSFGSLLFQLFH